MKWLTKLAASRLGRVVAALAVLLVFAGLVWYVRLPNVAELVAENPASTAFIDRYLERREADPNLPQVRWTWVPSAQISVHMMRAAVCAEDLEFFQHGGFSTSEIAAAIRQAWAERRSPRGASTITQQLAKNLWLSPARTPTRKLTEIALTRRLERTLSKMRILEIYLNVAEFGPGIYGVQAAARVYFGKTASALTEREAAMLAASLPRPARWHPGVESSSYQGYVEEVLDRMDRTPFLWRYLQHAAPAVETIADSIPSGG